MIISVAGTGYVGLSKINRDYCSTLRYLDSCVLSFCLDMLIYLLTNEKKSKIISST